MNEKEFDIQVRNLLLDAEEPVSPKVWEGVAAGLDRKRRVIPVRFWGYATALAAAAAVALFVLLKPAAPVVEPEHSNPSIFMSEASGETVPETEVSSTPVEEAPVAVVPSPRRKPLLAAQSATQQPAAQENPYTAPEAAPEEAPVVAQQPAAPAAPAAPQKEAASARKNDDQALLNQLAFEENTPKKASSGVSFSAFSNVQTSQRSGIHGNFRRYGAPSLNAGVGIYNESPEVSFALPFSVGVGVQFNFTPRWAIGTGIRYTNLGRTFVGDYKGEGFYLPQTDIDNHQHWLGVPVNVYYSFVNSSRWRVHAFAGGAAEWLVDNGFLVHNSPTDIHYHQVGTRPQFSGALGVGVEFKITPFLGIYLDPSFRYFFATDKQPRSLRTVQPLRFDVEAGLRFSIGK
ncbi:MAG: PorT family protein [Bacteroidales bacterium]|nr:PorT family protein [Bacteroidales bacterium]